MEKELAQHENAIKIRLVETLGFRSSSSRLFQVWQPHIQLWEAIMDQFAERCEAVPCFSKLLIFPYHYCLAALVDADSCEEVFHMMKAVHENDVGRVICLSQLIKSSSAGDVYVTPSGETHIAAPEGIITPLQRTMLS